MSAFSNFSNVVFNPETYKGCKVKRAEGNRDKIIVSRFGSSDLRLELTKHLEGWEPRLRIVAFLLDHAEPNHATIYSGEATKEARELWNVLSAQAMDTGNDDYDARVVKALNILGVKD